MAQFTEWVMDLFFWQRVLIRIAIFVGVAVFAWIVNLFVKKLILRAIKAIAKRTKNQWDNCLIKNKFFTRISHIAPAIVFYACGPLVFAGYEGGLEKMHTAVYLYLVFIGLFVVDAFLNSVVDIYRTFEFAKRMPIKGFIQVIKIIVAILAFITVLAVVLKKDPSNLIAGMGAMTAIMLLIFKDSILGFVAGIQLSTNKMVHIGDWIEMSKFGADGDVIDITLTTVKVQNWDKTISTIPAYALISDSFKNWRGMSESAGRRIKRSVSIDMNSIKFCTNEMLEKFRRFALISDYLDEKQKELTDYNAANNIDDSEMVNGRRLTNIGTFRAYVVAYLRSHPKVHKDMTFLVRQLEPTASGLPIQIYVFCNDKAWANYEAIQSDIFDHILAVVPQFELKVYQQPAGADFNSEFLIRNS
ncbi:MAG: mechanosensitive ion channel [Planctomycetes bacterium]|nr:mechanosensitive ion channel [Planctomycetota bacterium]